MTRCPFMFARCAGRSHQFRPRSYRPQPGKVSVKMGTALHFIGKWSNVFNLEQNDDLLSTVSLARI